MQIQPVSITSVWGGNILTLAYILPRKSFCSGSLLIRSFFNRSLPWAFSDSRLFLLAASFAFLIRFSSSEFEAKSSDSYSLTTFQPSLLLSAILINFCRRWIEAFAFVDQGSDPWIFVISIILSGNIVDDTFDIGVHFV